ncbi:Protein CBG07527 [Caenorhabditis briggsae]|uniref:Protein CBG07527 n=1 Tax=Caenorhabditis briggsae TaxID=6238 RepID=A8X4M2_CAEBR|nr:Protein CBG07527 [Caenorhabditis briggsae]CAP27582.1 Protein CBG07527 [Caenorhabditis briggsae]
MRRKRNPTMLKFRKLRKEQKLKMEQAFALSRKPDKATIASLPSERQLDKVRLYEEFFENAEGQ